jgi:hypothetical protein
MEQLGRIGVTVLAALAGFIVFNIVAGSMVAGVATAALALVTWFAAGSPHPIVRGAVLGAGWCGVIGFIGGFFGPMILAPESNQGPMLGIFITGPGGFVIGALCGAAIAAGKPG